MNRSTLHSRCRVVFPSQVVARVQPRAVLALLLRPSVMNLAELTCSIAADDNLQRWVTEAARREHECSRPGVEEAIVLLGKQGLCALLADHMLLEGKMK